jgi:hypothetical protein
MEGVGRQSETTHRTFEPENGEKTAKNGELGPAFIRAGASRMPLPLVSSEPFEGEVGKNEPRTLDWRARTCL